VLLRFKTQNGRIVVSYSDNGKGMTHDAQTKNGTRIMENRIRELNGTLTFDSGAGNGFRAQLEIPV
jgi:signal transduction histidine kinase